MDELNQSDFPIVMMSGFSTYREYSYDSTVSPLFTCDGITPNYNPTAVIELEAGYGISLIWDSSL